MQPFPGAKVGGVWAMLVMAVIAMAILVAATRASRVVFKDSVFPGPAEKATTAFTQPFNLSGNQNVQVRAYCNLRNTWAYVAGDLLNEETGALESFELPIEYYEGYSGNEHWSEGNRQKKVFLSAPAKGRYSMRLEVQWEKPGDAPVLVEVREGVFRFSHFLFALIAISIPAIFNGARAWSFERQRWQDSDYNPYSSGSSDEEE